MLAGTVVLLLKHDLVFYSMLEVTRQLLKKALDEYNCRYQTAFKLSEKYSLFPNEGEYGYNDEWPGNKHAGVYFVIAKDGELLYVGESQQIGRRLYEHFPPICSSSSQECYIKETWHKRPYYLYVAIVPDDATWERLSLEAFLIQTLNPIDNSRGKTH